MKIAVDATAIGSGLGGDETMIRGLLTGLAATSSADDDVTVLVRPDAIVPDCVTTDATFELRRIRRLPGAAHFTVGLPAALARLHPDVAFSVTHGPIALNVPVLLMVQDLSFHHQPEMYPRAARIRLNTIVPRQARRAAAVSTVSEFSRCDLIDSFGLDPDRVMHVPNVVEPPPPFSADQADAGRAWLKSQGVHGPFVLSLGNLHPRKNLARTIDAFLSSGLHDHSLVVAGARWWRADFTDLGSRASDRVIFVGRVDGEQREQLLHLADALVYLSLFEGFGLPPLEAMARGTPALVSDVTSLPEVTGDSALHVDPCDVEAIADGLRRLITDGALRAKLVARGFDRAAIYNAGATGRAARRAFSRAVEAQ